VGIGKTNPSYDLDVVGDINFSGNLYKGGSLVGSPWTESGSNVYRSSGNVGIGTTSPAYKLDVTGSARMTEALDVGTTLGVGSTATFDGNVNIKTTTNKISFGATHRQFIETATGGIGTQTETLYFRSDQMFGFYKTGGHSSTALDPGSSGSVLAVIRGDISGPRMAIGDTDTDSGYAFKVVGSAQTTAALDVGTTLDVGSTATFDGNVNIKTSTNKISFGTTHRQFIETATGGIGTQPNTLYFRSQDLFGFYKGGSHSNTALDPGGTLLVTIRGDISGPRLGVGVTNPTAALQVSGGGILSGALDVGTTLDVGSTATFDGNVNIKTSTNKISFGTTHRQFIETPTGGIGTQSNTLYFRSPDLFGFYKGGSHSNTALDPGGGTQLVTIRGDVSGPRLGVGVHNPSYALQVSGTAHVSGALSKGSGSFLIDHPLPEMKETHNLYHSFIEGPRADLIYRGKVRLTNGRAVVDLDEVSDMTSGTFTALNRDVQCFTSNESDWDAVRGSINGATLTIESQNTASTAVVSWLVIGERQDEHMYETEWTDENGRVVPEQLKKNATA